MKTNEVKKSQKANLESQKGMYWLMGVVVAVALVLLALEWTTNTRQVYVAQRDVIDMPEALPPVPRPPDPPPPPLEEIKEPPIPDPDRPPVVTDDPVPPIVFPGPYDPPPPPPPPIADPPPPPIETIWEIVEDPPMFRDGNLNAWLSRAIRYPQSALEMGIQGTVVLQFVIERDGSVTDIQVVRGVDPALNREAERVVRSMPAWTPARQAGETVRFRFTLPVRFVLSN